MLKRFGLLLSVLLLVSCFSVTAFAKSDFLVKEGMQGDNVRQVQELLIANGFLTGSADGICGSQTVEAIKKFQQSIGVEADGICGDETIALLRGQSQTSGTAGDSSGLLKPGASGDRVKAVQEMLFNLGYLQTSPDGVYGSMTESAVMNFQRDSGLSPDGICGDATFTKLKEKSSPNEAYVSLNSDVVAAANTNDNGTGPLKPGMAGERVRALQELLYKRGYLLTDPDGVYGTLTENAVTNFQADTGLTPDGICGDATMQKLLYLQENGSGEESAYAAPGAVIKPGMRGDGVILLQEYLIDLGYLHDNADGLYGPNSVSALKAFQRDNGIEADGICGSSTYQALSMQTNPVDEPAPAQASDEAQVIFGRAVRVEATAYSSMDPGISLYTATGKFLRKGIISVDPSFIPLGTHVYIPGYGEATADDLGGDIKGNRIDIAFDTHSEAMSFGRQTIDIYIIEE